MLIGFSGTDQRNQSQNGLGFVDPTNVWDYLVQVQTDVQSLDKDVTTDIQTPPPNGKLPLSFTGEWTSFVNARPFDINSVSGWYDFFAHSNSLGSRLWNGQAIMDATSAYNADLLRYYDQAVAYGIKPSRPRPSAGFIPPPPMSTEGILDRAETAIGHLILGALALGGLYVVFKMIDWEDYKPIKMKRLK